MDRERLQFEARWLIEDGAETEYARGVFELYMALTGRSLHDGGVESADEIGVTLINLYQSLDKAIADV